MKQFFLILFLSALDYPQRDFFLLYLILRMMLVEILSVLASFCQHCKWIMGLILAVPLAIAPIFMVILTLSLVSFSKLCMGWVPRGLMVSFPTEIRTSLAHGQFHSMEMMFPKAYSISIFSLGMGPTCWIRNWKNPPVVAVVLCNLLKEQSLSCCRCNSSTDFCFHLIKLQHICLLVGFI